MSKWALFWAVVLILFGALLLLNNLGILDVDIWGLFWSLLLILLGVWVLAGLLFGPRSSEAVQVAVPLEGARQARVHVHHGAGQLRINAGAGGGDLAAGTFRGGLDHHVQRDNETLDVDMRVPRQRFAFPWFWSPGSSLDWEFGLNPEVSLSLDVDTGASESRLDLADLRLTDLRLNTGASSVTAILPAHAGHTRVRLASGVASVRIQVPDGVAARIGVQSGLAGITVDRQRFPRTGGVYQSADYETAANRVEIHIETGVGAVKIR